MSGTISTNAPPVTIIVTQNAVGPAVSISQAAAVAVPPPPAINPLASDPGQIWVLQTLGGVLGWVEFLPPAGQSAWGLEDGLGAILLEDGAGYLLLEA